MLSNFASGHPLEFKYMSPNISTNRAFISSFKFISSCFRCSIIILVLSIILETSYCFSIDISGIFKFASVSIFIPLIVAPRAWEFRYWLFPIKHLQRYSLHHLVSSIPIRETISWLVDISTKLMATFPTPTRVPIIMEFAGTILAALCLIASSVIQFTASLPSIPKPFKATVVIHGISPSKNFWLFLDGVPPDWKSHISPSLTYIYFWWAVFTLFWLTIAYFIVVSIWEWPRIFCTCSIGIPLSIALVAIDRRNLCGWILSRFNFRPSFRSLISTPLIFSRSYGASKVTNRAELLSVLLSMYSFKWTLALASK